MFPGDATGENSSVSVTRREVLEGMAAGAASGFALGPICVIVCTLFWYWVVEKGRGDGMVVVGSFVGCAHWMVLGTLAGALGSLLSGVVKRFINEPIWVTLASLSGGLYGIGLLDILISRGKPLFEWMTAIEGAYGIGMGIAGAAAGFLGKRYNDITYALWSVPGSGKRGSSDDTSHLDLRPLASMGFAFLLAALSLLYVWPVGCQELCVSEPCLRGTCLEGEQRAGFPFPVYHDNNIRHVPGWESGIGTLGREDRPNPAAFFLNFLFYSITIWLLWDRSWWHRLRHHLALPKGQ